jgi:hypothetical protein
MAIAAAEEQAQTRVHWKALASTLQIAGQELSREDENSTANRLFRPHVRVSV